MDTLSDNGSNSNVVQIWSRVENPKISEDPLDDLINEFGTEIKEEESVADV